MIRLDDLHRCFIDLLFSLFFRQRLNEGQTEIQIRAASVARCKAAAKLLLCNSIHTQIAATNNESTALKNTLKVIWDTFKSLEFSSDSARLPYPSDLIPFPPACSTPSANTPTLNATTAVMTQTPTAFHVMSPFVVASCLTRSCDSRKFNRPWQTCHLTLNLGRRKSANVLRSFSLELVLKVQHQSIASGIRSFVNKSIKCQCLGSEYTGNL